MCVAACVYASIDEELAVTQQRAPSLHGRPVTGSARHYAQYPSPQEPSDFSASQVARPDTAIRGRTPHVGRRKDSMLDKGRKGVGGESLFESTDDEWYVILICNIFILGFFIVPYIRHTAVQFLTCLECCPHTHLYLTHL